MKSKKWILTYFSMASASLVLALVVSMKMLTVAHAQSNSTGAPSSGELPPEFLEETTANTNDATSSSSSGNVAAPQAGDLIYDPTGRRDPFKPYTKTVTVKTTTVTELSEGKDGTKKAVTKKVRIESGPVGPLQKWDLEKYRVVGILWDVKKPRAMLRDPDGTIYTVMQNSKVGRNNGSVIAIREGEVVVEQFIDDNGAELKQTKVLELGR